MNRHLKANPMNKMKPTTTTYPRNILKRSSPFITHQRKSDTRQTIDAIRHPDKRERRKETVSLNAK